MSKFQKIDVAKYETPSKFIKWKPGDNRIRVVSEPYMYSVVGKRTAKGYVRHVLEDGVDVPEFLKDASPKQTYGFIVFNHEDGHFHIIETGVRLGDQLTKLIQQKYPEEYKAADIIVKVKGQKLDREYDCSYAEKSLSLPKGVSKDSAEFRYIKSYFEGL